MGFASSVVTCLSLAACGGLAIPGLADKDGDGTEDGQRPSGPVSGTPEKTPPAVVLSRPIACAVVLGNLRCWGDTGPVAGAAVEDGVATVDLGDRTVVRLALGNYHACAVVSERDVLCWGGNEAGQLGQGDTQPRDVDDGIADLGTLRLGTRIADVAVGKAHSCALAEDGGVMCWGQAPAHGAGSGLDIGAVGGEPLSAIPSLPLASPVEAIAAGSEHTCALLRDGGVQCWGDNEWGQLGLGDVEPRGSGPDDLKLLPTVDLGGPAQQISAAGSISCAVLIDDTVKCWGAGNHGALGTGDRNDRGDEAGEMGSLLPINLPLPVLAVHTSGAHTCALLKDEAVRCWGNNETGALGVGHSETIGDTPGEMGQYLIGADLGGRAVLDVRAGGARTCAVLADASVRCWGRGIGDELGEMGDALPAIDL